MSINIIPNNKRAKIGIFRQEDYFPNSPQMFDSPPPRTVWEAAIAKTPELLEWLENSCTGRYVIADRGIGMVAIILRGPKPYYLQLESEEDAILLHLTMGDTLIPKDWINR